MPKLKDWRFTTALGLYREPVINTEGNEVHQTRLFGRVYDDARRDILTREFDDGHRIITSPVFEINWEERYIKTRSGTKYELCGNPDEEYVAWLRAEGLWDKHCDIMLLPAKDLN
jgi:hypothetical protein